MGTPNRTVAMLPRSFPVLAAIPPLALLAIALLFYAGLSRESPEGLPSVLVGRQAPELVLEALGDLRQPSPFGVGERPTIVNFWASWCLPCRVEHPQLTELGKRGYRMVGVNYKDERRNALEFLRKYGNPFSEGGADPTGRNALEWGVYGVPETFIVAPSGNVKLRFAGPITSRVFTEIILPSLAEPAS